MSTTIRQFSPADVSSATALWESVPNPWGTATSQQQLTDLKTNERSMSLIANQDNSGNQKVVGLAISNYHPGHVGKATITLITDGDNQELSRRLLDDSVVKVRSRGIRTFKLVGPDEATLEKIWNEAKWSATNPQVTSEDTSPE